MGTRTNFYKNPSYSYNKKLNLNSALQNLRNYNIAIGNVPPMPSETAIENAPTPRRKNGIENAPTPSRKNGIENAPSNKTATRVKRHREVRLLLDRRDGLEENERPMSHEEYIEKRRKEADFSPPYLKLTTDVLESSSSALNLVGYESDNSTSSGCEEELAPLKSSGGTQSFQSEMHYFPIIASMDEAGRIKAKSDQRYPISGEPVCIMCGKYGEYICNETDDDVCSMDCKAELLQSIKSQQVSENGEPRASFSARRCTLEVPESGGDIWDYDRHRWSEKRSGLCTYECWKCQKPGHLAEDCLVSVSRGESNTTGKSYNHVQVVQNKPNYVPGDLRDLYKRCHRIGKNFLAAKCCSCRGSTTLATCLRCDNSFCDCAGHLSQHIREHPTHQQYYSYKLNRLVKCCKSTCKVTHLRDLLACHYCFDKAFDKFYDMYTATWNPSGLSIIWNSICCEDHFEWHRMNCLNADVEDSAYILKSKRTQNEKSVQLGDFIF